MGEELGYVTVIGLFSGLCGLHSSMSVPLFSACSKGRGSGYRIQTGPHCFDPPWPSGNPLSPQSFSFHICKSLD